MKPPFASNRWRTISRSSAQDMNAVASLSGKKNTTAFAMAEIDRAEKANVTPEEAKQFSEAYLSKASLYVGDGPNAKLSQKDSNEFTSALMEYAKQKGVSQQEMAGFAGGLLAQQKGPTNATEMKTRAGKVFATLEASSAEVGHLLPMMTRIQAQGFSAEEAAPLLAGMPEIAPEEEGTHLLRAIQVARELDIEGKGKEYGVEHNATPYQRLRGLVKNLEGRKANGEDLDKVLKEIAPESIGQNTLRGLVDQGDRGLEKWKKLVDETTPDVLKTTIEENRGTETARQAKLDAAQAAEEARMAHEMTRWLDVARLQRSN